MKKWICAMLCLSMTAGLASVQAEASAEKDIMRTESGKQYESTAFTGDMELQETMSVNALAAKESAPSEKPTASPIPATNKPDEATATPAATATASVETDKMETAAPLPPFTGNKVIDDENVFVTTENSADKSCTITGYNGDTGVTTLYIPAQIKKKTVASVAEEVLTKCRYLKNVVVLGDTEFQGTKVFDSVSGVEIWAKTGGKANTYATTNGLLFHALEGPAKISGKSSSNLKSATVTWEAVNGAVSYNVYRKQGKGKYALNTSTAAVTVTNQNLKPGATYVYKVQPVFTAANGDAIEGLASKETSVSMTPSKPKNVKAKGVRGGIRIKWTRDKNANGYQVFRKAHVKGFKTVFYRVKTIKGNKKTVYRDKRLVPKFTYSYKVRSYKTVNGKKIFGSYTTVTTKAR